MEHKAVEAAYDLIRFNTKGELRFDDRLQPVKFIIAPDGRLAAPVPRDALRAVDTVLFIPEYCHNALELLVTLEALDACGPLGCLVDRWAIYYGHSHEPAWAILNIETARHGAMVLEGDALTRPNPLAGDEARLCRMINERHVDALRAIVARLTSVRVERPAVVGADCRGIDVRASFGIIRVPFSRPMQSGPEAEAALLTLLGGDQPMEGSADDTEPT